MSDVGREASGGVLQGRQWPRQGRAERSQGEFGGGSLRFLLSRSRSVILFFLSSFFTNSRWNEISFLASEFRLVSDSLVLDLMRLLTGSMVLGVLLV